MPELDSPDIPSKTSDLLDPDPMSAMLGIERRDQPLRVIPLGGVGEFGQNMMLYETEGERLIVDCGVMFPEADMLGVDLVIPDIDYRLDEPDKLKGIVLTHIHEDHIGGVPYVLDQIQAPVWATRLTLAYLEDKLLEHDVPRGVEFHEMRYRRPFRVGSQFVIEPIHVTHSVPDAAALGIHTPAGTVVHTGDYKIDHSPVDGVPFDFYSFARLGEEGVLALFGDSTNASVEGVTETETWVDEQLEPIFATSEQTIFAVAFSTSIPRLQVLVDLAIRTGRKIAVVGRSMERTFRIATDLGYLKLRRQNMCSLQELMRVPENERLIIATGSQGEPMAAMARIARDEHKSVQIEEGDTVILSAREIPSNLRAINHMINHLCRRGARIYDQSSARVHASGHARAEEVKQMISLTRPGFVIPVHGEPRMLQAHRELALSMGMPEESVLMVENGDILEFMPPKDHIPATVRVVGRIDSGHVLVDGKTVGETGDVVLRDRRHLSEDGMIIAILNVDHSSGRLLTDPEIVTRGFVYVDESEELLQDLRLLVRETFTACPLEAREDAEVLNTEIRRALRRYIRKTYERFPLILPVVQEI